MNKPNMRTILTAFSVALGMAGGAYALLAVLNAILEASPITKFLLGAGLASGGTMTAYLSMKGS